MKALHMWTLASILVLLSQVLSPPGTARAAMTTDRVLTGELVVINAARNQFRLVERQGSFTAPVGTQLEAFRGKPVRVELGQNGRVLQISEMPIHIVPITHSFETLSGEVVLRDPRTRTFGIAGDARTFVAPRATDIGQYAGQLVEMNLDEQGQVVNFTPIARFGDAPPRSLVRKCILNDASLASGSSICRGGTTFRCTNGEWVALGTPCS